MPVPPIAKLTSALALSAAPLTLTRNTALPAESAPPSMKPPSAGSASSTRAMVALAVSSLTMPKLLFAGTRRLSAAPPPPVGALRVTLAVSVFSSRLSSVAPMTISPEVLPAAMTSWPPSASAAVPAGVVMS